MSAIDQPLDIPLCRVDRLILGREPFDELELSDAQRECRCDDCGNASGADQNVDRDDFNLPF